MYDGYLGGKLALNVLYLAPEHEGLQDLMQSVNDNYSLLHGYIILPTGPRGSLPKAVTKPLCKLVLVIKHLNSAAKVQSDGQVYLRSALQWLYSRCGACRHAVEFRCATHGSHGRPVHIRQSLSSMSYYMDTTCCYNV